MRIFFLILLIHLNQSLYVDTFSVWKCQCQAALTTCIESKEILEDASMDLRKWRTNSSELNQRLKNLNFEVDEHKGSLNTLIASKVLGVGWNEKSDTFYFDSSDLGTFFSKRINTKRYLLQAAGRLFDPGGRLKHSTLSEFQKHQMMLPKAHHLTDLIIEYYHKKSLHSGLQTTLYLIRQFYWTPSGQNHYKATHLEVVSDMTTEAFLACLRRFASKEIQAIRDLE
ncbi:uncharacterized protein TNCV_2044621 [Trichonephila clavipes]|nr:uncharacterized protein TNCV_2044621 [Trichonephila clavipes]